MKESNSSKKTESDLLVLKASKGFSYNIPDNIVLTTFPGIGIIYFLQCSVKFYDGQNYIDLHKTQNPVSTLCLRGKWLAIGQKMLKGQLTTTTIIDLQTKKKKLYRYQKTAIQSLNLSRNGEYLSSVGSTDPLRQQFLIISLFQELQYGFKAIVQEQYDRKSQKIIMTVFSNRDPNMLAMIFANKVTILRIQGEKVIRKIAKSSKVRQFSMGIFEPKDLSCYICSKNGDISDIDVKQLKQNRIGPKKRVIISGIKHIRYVHPNRLIITGVKGFIALLELKQLKVLKEVSIKQQITSLTEFQGDLGFLSTIKANIYILNAQTLDIKQFYQCHSARINQICFVDNFSEVFATCADNQIMLWRNYNLAPIIKISLPKSLCLSLNLLRDGSCIISGWSDDCIRFFNPKTGKKMNEITNAHNGKITALTSNMNSDRLFSGGDDGRIRSWKLQKQRFGIIQNIFTVHKSQIHYLKLHDEELFACSQDGCFSVWNSITGEKKLVVEASNFLRKVVPIDAFTVYGIGSGPYLLKVAKIDGKILEKHYIGGSHLNDFDVSYTSGKDQFSPVRQNIVLGGQLHSIFLKQIDDTSLQIQSRSQQFYAYGQVTCVKFSPDLNSVIGATADGSLICYECNFK